MANGDWLTQIIMQDMAEQAAQRAQQQAIAARMADPSSDYNQRLRAAELAAAEQNQFNRDITSGNLGVSRGHLKVAEGNLGVSRQNADTNRYTAETGRFSAETDRMYREALIEQAEKDLAFKYHQQAQEYEMQRGRLGLDTLTVGASLRGPRDQFFYQEAAAGAAGNPLTQGAVATWADLTNNRPTGGGAWNAAPTQRFDLNALASDFMGGPQGSLTPGSQSREATLAAANRFFENPGTAAPGWLESRNPTQREMLRGAADYLGHDWGTVLSRYALTRPSQGLGYAGA